jgi:flagellar biosynthetic protein FliP
MDALLSLSEHASLPLDTLAGLTLLSLLPLLLFMATSFVRIAVVLSFVRSAIGASALPPNAALSGLALMLTFVVMAPTGERIAHEALEPYERGTISRAVALRRAEAPLRAFMLRQTERRDIALFARTAHRPRSEALAAAPLTVLIPAFVVNELRNGFGIGLALYLPFVAIDLAVSAILMGLGMMMLSPPVISLPCKLMLFVLVDGWGLVCGSLVRSFR